MTPALAAIQAAANQGAPTRLVHAWLGMLHEGDEAGALAGARGWLKGQELTGKIIHAIPGSGVGKAALRGLAGLPAGKPWAAGALTIAVILGAVWWLQRNSSDDKE